MLPLSVAGGVFPQDMLETDRTATPHATTHGEMGSSSPSAEGKDAGNSDSHKQPSQYSSQQDRQVRALIRNRSDVPHASAKVWTASNIHEWQPDRWYPSEIAPRMFYPGPSSFIPHFIDGGKVGYPVLLLDWALFRSLLRNAWNTREYEAADALRQKERKRIIALQEQLMWDKRFREDQMITRREQHWWPPRTREQTYQDDEQVKNLIDENDALYDKLSAELQGIDENCQKVLDKVEHSRDELIPLLDDLFGRMGALPDFTNPESYVKVPVFEKWHKEEDVALDWPENTWNDIEGAWSDSPPLPWAKRRDAADYQEDGALDWLDEDPDDTWNNAWEDYPQENPVVLAEFKVDKALEAYQQVSSEFDKFRDNYYGDLYWYIAKNHKFRMYRNNETEIAELEHEFDAEWFVKFRSIARKLNRAEKVYMDAEKERLETERLFPSKGYFDETADHVNAQLSSTPSRTDVEAFGETLSFGQMKRIVDWLEPIPSLEYLEPIPSMNDVEAPLDNMSSRKRKRTDDGLDNASLSKRQRQTREFDIDTTVAMLDIPQESDLDATAALLNVPDDFGYVSVWELAIGYQRQQIDDWAQQARQAWEETKARL